MKYIKRTILGKGINSSIAVLHEAVYNKTSNYYNITENWLNFIGSITGNVAVAENANGEAKFYAVPAYTNRPVLMVYTNNKTLMPGSGDINFDSEKQVQVARLQGSATEKYLLFTGDADGKLYYHEVDMALNGGMGDIALANQELDNDNSDYYGQLLAIEDESTETIKLLATRLSGSTLHLVSFDITGELSGALAPTELLTIDGSYGVSDMKLSPDGKKLLIYNFTGTGELGVKPAELLVYNVTEDYRMAGVNGETYTGEVTSVPVINRVTIPEGTVLGSGADFTSTGSMVVYSQVTATTEQIGTADLVTNVSITLLSDASGDISLRSDGKVYISLAGSNELLAYESDLETNHTVPLATTLSGYMANKVYRNEATENITERLYARRTGLKQYELKDHLGNVRTVVSDLKTATGQGAIPVNDASVLAYYNYYPFGMRMPGRYSPANLVGQGGYRFGFNGKEKDDDFGGSTGAVYDYGFRIYDARIGRFLSTDPLFKKFPMLSTYQFSSNNPIWAIDLDGLEAIIYDINFDGDKITTTKIELEKAGALGNGVAIRTNKGGSTTYFYGNEIPSGNGELFTKGYEGKELKSYKDQYGNLTAGYGHLLSKDEQKTYTEGTAITEDQANTWFTSDYSSIKSSVQKNKINDAGLTGTQEDAVIDFYYNVGPNHKADFKGSGKGGNFFLGYMAGGKGIWKRRFAEKLLYEDGKYLKFDPVNGKKDNGTLDQLYKDNIPAPEAVPTVPAPTEKNKLKMKNILFAISLFSLISCKAQEISLYGNWKIIDLKNIVSIDKDDLQELKKKCLGTNVEITENSIIIKNKTNCDFKGCNELELIPVDLKVIDDEESKRYSGQEVYKDEISKTFLTFIGLDKSATIVKAYNTSCKISWGNETLRIIPIEKNNIIVLQGSYVLNLERKKVKKHWQFIQK